MCHEGGGRHLPFLEAIILFCLVDSQWKLTINIEPRHEKTCLRGFHPSETQTCLLNNRSLLESWNFGYNKDRYYNCSCTCWSVPLLFAYGINRFSHDVAHTKPADVKEPLFLLYHWVLHSKVIKIHTSPLDCGLEVSQNFAKVQLRKRSLEKSMSAQLRQINCLNYCQQLEHVWRAVCQTKVNWLAVFKLKINYLSPLFGLKSSVLMKMSLNRRKCWMSAEKQREIRSLESAFHIYSEWNFAL